MPVNHARVRQLFLAALELPVPERAAYLQRSGATEEIVRQVEDLLQHASPQTVLDVAIQPRGASEPLSISRLAPILRFLAPFTTSRAARWTTRAVVLALLALAGWIVRTNIHNAVSSRTSGILRAIQSSSAVALENQLAAWRLEVDETVAPGLCRQAALAVIRNPSATNLEHFHHYAGALVESGEFLDYYLEDAQGRPIAITGKLVNQPSASSLGTELRDRIFASTRTLTRIPGIDSPLGTRRSENELKKVVAFHVPLIEDGKPFGIFVAYRSMEGLDLTLQHTRILETGESYVFSLQGLMLSPSRFQDQIKKWDLGATPTGQPLIYLRDPGRSLANSPIGANEQPAVWPVTLLVRTAAAARSGPKQEDSGVITTPYRDYRGELVLSAWSWLPDLDVGVATEVDISEAFLLSNMLDRALLGLLIGIGFTAVWALVSTSWAVRMGRAVERRGSLGAYSLIEKIGEGGMGEVYLAHHAFLQRTAAVKLLRRDRTDKASFAKFQNEVRVASRLRHPNTVEIYDFGRAKDGTFYCAMEYLPGMDLGEWIQRSGKMPLERTIHIVRQICSALSEAHAEGLLHRDVKPSNVMVCSMGGLYDFVKLLDFGLAVSVHDRNGNDGLDLSGTPYYTAPERLNGEGPVDARCDIYSLGTLWYFLLAARLPHSAGVPWVEATLNLDAPTVSSFIEVDPEVAELIASCIARRVEDRPASTLVLLDRLDALARRFPWLEESAREAWQT
ncbi:MAG: serine/threonine-protein kinase [Bryobacteraceae bacterium]